jgi:hypothetical protein
MSDAPNGSLAGISKMEGRWVAFLTTIALAFGGIWLQNQYETTLRLQEQVADFMQHVDAGYVRKDYLTTVESRLVRIEDKLDDLRDKSVMGPGGRVE